MTERGLRSSPPRRMAGVLTSLTTNEGPGVRVRRQAVHPVGALKARVAATHGKNIGKVAAARRQVELVSSALRDHHVRAPAPAAGSREGGGTGVPTDKLKDRFAMGVVLCTGNGRCPSVTAPGRFPTPLSGRDARGPEHPPETRQRQV